MSKFLAQFRKDNALALAAVDDGGLSYLVLGPHLVSPNMVRVQGHLDPCPDKGQEQTVERAPVHGHKVQELPKWLLSCGRGPVLRRADTTHLSDRSGNPEPLRVQLALETHQKYLQT